MKRTRLLVGLLVVGSLVAVQPVGAHAGTWTETVGSESTAAVEADSEPPETADEYLAAFQSMEGAPAFERYTEFQTIRSLAVSKLQVAEFDADTEQEMATTLELLRSFREAYQAAQNESGAASLAAANRTQSHVAALNEQGRTYATLADIALNRFYENRGAEFLQSATNATRTPTQIEQLRRASVAFKRAGASQKFSEVNLRYQQVRSEYEANVETMNASASTAGSFLSACESCSSVEGALTTHGVETFDLYLRTGGTLSGLREAESLADGHGLSDQASTYAGLQDDVSSARTTLAAASAALLLAYGLVIALLAMFVAHRLVTWRETVQASQVGEIVVLRGVNDA